MVFVLDVDRDLIVEGYLHPQLEPPLAVTIAIGRALATVVERPDVVEIETEALLPTVRATLPGVPVEVGACEQARAAVQGRAGRVEGRDA